MNESKIREMIDHTAELQRKGDPGNALLPAFDLYERTLRAVANRHQDPMTIARESLRAGEVFS